MAEGGTCCTAPTSSSSSRSPRPTAALVTLGLGGRHRGSCHGPVQINHRRAPARDHDPGHAPERCPWRQPWSSSSEEILRRCAARRQVWAVSTARPLSGSRGQADADRQALRWNLVLAIVITYLLMAALFESFLYPFVIMFSVPLAALGGFLGLALNLFTYQPLTS